MCQVVFTDHECERCVPQVLGRCIAAAWRRRRSVDGGESVGHSRADEERAVAPVRITDEIYAIRIDLFAGDEGADETIGKAQIVPVVEAVPIVVWGANREI